MATFTSSLPDEMLKRLQDLSAELKVPKNRILERALDKYLHEVERKIFIRSYQAMSGDQESLSLAEEGIEEYHDELRKLDEKM
ncbi:MAG: ribbon-helix-helix domain-containing protein [Saprospiraceae bacterium]|nr:ribbon-helix-helix domain-containing protein [Saprospiraceae bacterium]